MASHNLFLGMYSLGIKKKFGKNSDLISTNDFLSNAYNDVEKKFEEGFVQDIIKQLDTEKSFKNSKNTHGGILEKFDFNNSERTLDLLINGGLTGVKQYIINEEKEKKIVSDKDIVGLVFFARIWFPSNSNSAFIFIQKHGSLSIKPLYDELLKKVLNPHDFGILGRKLQATTTKRRQKEFLKNSNVLDITIVSKKSVFDTASISAKTATIKFSSIKNSSQKVDKNDIKTLLLRHGVSFDDKGSVIKVTYGRSFESYKEKKTVEIDDTEETINIIPNIKVPNECINADNSPNFKKMQGFVDAEMTQIIKEAKKS
ncbi:hypothetical protein [uncultured Tenacibaculum sp.]|uniref:hypothetical protein n=1 Tax=uncultured Tenacibaculum sp. TaxID=174713 RepID=UPI0026229191|nr:hypothetical protein [uncultured Tenacibaculum sp.]